MSMEAGVVVGKDGKAIHWHLPEERTGGSLPDSQALWDFIWKNRNEIMGIAHSHPGRGLPGPSHTDVTTFAAIEDGLGKRLLWWITSEDKLVVIKWVGPGKHTYSSREISSNDPEWLKPLRNASHELSEARLEEVCQYVTETHREAARRVSAGKAALEDMVVSVLNGLPHADPDEIRKKILDSVK